MERMVELPNMIDQAYLISVQDLREICSELTSHNCEYRLLRPNDGHVLIRFNDDAHDVLNLNALSFTFPIVVNVAGLAILHKNPEAGQMVCMSVYTAKQTQHGFYPDEDGELKMDLEGDWGRFWQPLAALLLKEYESL
jgi:hypothetical protein